MLAASQLPAREFPRSSLNKLEPDLRRLLHAEAREIQWPLVHHQRVLALCNGCFQKEVLLGYIRPGKKTGFGMVLVEVLSDVDLKVELQILF